MIWLTKIKEEQNMFSENLKTLRKEKGFSQEQLATRLNVVRQTISKWEKGISVPDAETLIQLADVLEVEVSDLLGKKIEIEEGQNELDALALELAKLNELLVVYGNKASDLKKKIGKLIAVILLVLFVCAIFGTWTDIWHEFGQNLYHLLNN
jgi:putative transcriptional regulator